VPVGPAEAAALIGLLWTMRPRPVTVVIGSARDPMSRANAALLAAAWPGEVLDTVTWPEVAASWLRQARRLTASGPDAWLVTGTPAGWVGMGHRLAHSTNWSARRTVATSGLADPAILADPAFTGLRGTHPDGRTWEVE
jgi:CelD/BcsL family acetyltransferase involved in cellulose biosynthesis